MMCVHIYTPLRRHVFVCLWRDSPQWARASSFTRFLDHTQWRTTVGRTPLDEWSARRKVLYLKTHTTLTTVIHPCPGGIRTHNLRKPAAADLRLRPRGHWDRHKDIQVWIFFVIAVLVMAPLDHVATGTGTKTYRFEYFLLLLFW